MGDGTTTVRGLTLTGVTMELAGGAAATTVVEDVAVTLGPDGVLVAAPGAAVTALGWADVAGARCGEPGLLADGSPAVGISAQVAGRLVRWLVPEEQMGPERAVAVDLFLAARTGRPPTPPSEAAAGRRGRRARRPARPDPAALLAPARRDPGESPVAPPRVAARAPAPPVSDPPRAAPPPLAAAPPRERRAPDLERVLWAAVLVLVLAALAVLAGGLLTAPSPPSTPRAVTPLPADRRLARAVNLTLADLPQGWTVSTTPSGPLSGFLGGYGYSGTVAPGSPVGAEVARQFAHCLGISPAHDAVMGTAGPAPVAHASSRAFVGPETGPPEQTASLAAVYGRAGPVAAAVAQLRKPRFASCFGAAVGKEFTLSAKASGDGGGVTYGTARAVALSLPQRRGAFAAGVDLYLPLQFGGTRTTVELGFVLVGGGRIESTLVTFATGGGFPSTLTRSLAGSLERRVAAGVST